METYSSELLPGTFRICDPSESMTRANHHPREHPPPSRLQSRRPPWNQGAAEASSTLLNNAFRRD